MRLLCWVSFALVGCTPLPPGSLAGLGHTCLPLVEFLKAADGNCYRVGRGSGTRSGLVVKTYRCSNGVIVATDLGNGTVCVAAGELPGPVLKDRPLRREIEA